MRDSVVRRRIYLLAGLLVAAALFVLAASFAVIAYALGLGDYWRALAASTLSSFLELPIAIDGELRPGI